METKTATLIGVNKANLEVIGIASTDKTRQCLIGVHITKDYTEATNGIALIRVATPRGNENEGEIILSPTSVKDILRKIGKSDALVGDESCEIGHDGAGHQERLNVTSIDLKFPNIDAVMPKAEDLNFEITFSIDLLAQFFTTLKKINPAGRVTLHFQTGGDPKPVKSTCDGGSDGQTITGLIMPMWK